MYFHISLSSILEVGIFRDLVSYLSPNLQNRGDRKAAFLDEVHRVPIVANWKIHPEMKVQNQRKKPTAVSINSSGKLTIEADKDGRDSNGYLIGNAKMGVRFNVALRSNTEENEA